MTKSKEALEFGPFFAALRGESDRAAAVLGPAYVDAALERLFRARLTATANEKLFGFGMPLGDFSGKIELAYALGWIPKSLRDDLHIVRRIRNDFAHAANHELSFEAAGVSDQTLSLSVVAQFTDMAETARAGWEPERAERMRAEMVRSLVGSSRSRFELVVANAEIFLGNAIKASSHAAPNDFKWTARLVGDSEEI